MVCKLSEVDVIRASLSELHTSMTILRTRMWMLACLLVGIHIKNIHKYQESFEREA